MLSASVLNGSPSSLMMMYLNDTLSSVAVDVRVHSQSVVISQLQDPAAVPLVTPMITIPSPSSIFALIRVAVVPLIVPVNAGNTGMSDVPVPEIVCQSVPSRILKESSVTFNQAVVISGFCGSLSEMITLSHLSLQLGNTTTSRSPQVVPPFVEVLS